MGMFSWLDCITQEQVIDGKPRKSYLLVPEEFGGGHIEEPCYEGYGVFGGHDVYDLVVDWNRNHFDYAFSLIKRWRCRDWLEKYRADFKRVENGLEPRCEKRTLGIALACYDEDNARLRYPIKITHDPRAVYEWCGISRVDPNQGWADENDDDWYDDDE